MKHTHHSKLIFGNFWWMEATLGKKKNRSILFNFSSFCPSPLIIIYLLTSCVSTLRVFSFLERNSPPRRNYYYYHHHHGCMHPEWKCWQRGKWNLKEKLMQLKVAEQSKVGFSKRPLAFRSLLLNGTFPWPTRTCGMKDITNISQISLISSWKNKIYRCVIVFFFFSFLMFLQVDIKLAVHTT